MKKEIYFHVGLAKTGSTLIWPATWTHTHKGVISKTQTKYIITGWYSYYNNDKA